MRLQGKKLQNATNNSSILKQIIVIMFQKIASSRTRPGIIVSVAGDALKIVIRQLRFSFRPSTRVGSVRYLSRASADPVINYKNGGGW